MRTYLRKREGQTLIIALFVTFILIFLGLLFAGIVAHNLFFTNREQAATGADNLAESGIRYAHQQLLQSPLGADWRPIPANLAPAAQATDPDFVWLQVGGPDGKGSFTRVLFDQGRALIRVSYDPKISSDPAKSDIYSNYIMIESVGRPGEFRPNDPTMVLGETTNLSRAKIAYAPIGITDYAWFVTNIDRISRQVEFGYPADFGARFASASDIVQVPMFVGLPDLAAAWGTQPSSQTYGGPMRINGGLKVYGDLRVWLNPLLDDRVLVSGDISFSDSSSLKIFTHDTSGIILPSSNPGYDSMGGLVRDGRRQQDVKGASREATYLDPPIMNELDPATGRERYRAATRFSGQWLYDNVSQSYYNTGRLGYGDGVYVENTGDLQSDVQSFTGGQSLVTEWLNPGGTSGNWNGPYYVPPGCYIQLVPDGFIITRNSHDDAGTWRTPDNKPTSRNSLRFTIGKGANGPWIYSDVEPSASPRRFNGVIYCEGNVRIRGIIPVNQQLTVVSNGTIYVEGNIIKGSAGQNDLYPSAALSLLAHDYVCVNTTQFVGPAPNRPLNFEPDPQDIPAPYHITISQSKAFSVLLSFGIDPTTYTSVGNDQGYMPRLYIRHAAEPDGQTFINIVVNSALYQFLNQPPNGASQFFPGNMATIPAYGLTDPQYQVYPAYEQTSFPLLDKAQAYALNPVGVDNVLTFQNDSSLAVSLGNRLYWLGAATVQPMDIKIEALMYAQTGSFFVIPGPWLNGNPNDRRDVYMANGSSLAARNQYRLRNFGANPEFPFYGEPLAIRITVDGAIAEAFPAPLADREEWMRHWAWMPTEFGGSGEHVPKEFMTSNNATYVPNLFIRHDPTFTTARAGGWVNQDPTAVPPLRRDAYQRTLPATPMLPVSPRLLYFGEVNP